jgi:hypothetical protein
MGGKTIWRLPGAPAKENPGEGNHTGVKKQVIADGRISDRHIARTPSVTGSSRFYDPGAATRL